MNVIESIEQFGYNSTIYDVFQDYMKNNYFKVFLRGYFTKYGIISTRELQLPYVKIAIQNKHNLEYLVKMYPNYSMLPSELSEYLVFSGVNALEFLYSLYKDVTELSSRIVLESTNYKLYLSWILLSNTETIPVCNIELADIEAVLPTKALASDVGYDLTIIKEVKVYGKNTKMYETGIKVEIPIGYYTKIVPRSSLIKSGYMLTNSVGIIDTAYRNTLKICLTKIDDSMPDLELPFKCCQLILEKLNHYELREVKEISENTERGLGGFGSTDLKK